MIALIDYEMGNLHSVNKALEKCGGKVKITSDPKVILQSDKIVLPGVGAIQNAKESLIKFGLWNLIPEIIESGKPFLGICLGMQMLFDESEEGEEPVKGLGIIPGQIEKFPYDKEYKVPHMGWNNVSIKADHPCLQNIPDDSSFYFVHSYYARPKNPEHIALSCDYGVSFAAAVTKDNLFATQFHPEKSQSLGLKLLENFVRL